jgi:hypothetical protein
MEPNPYEAPKTDQKQSDLPDGANTAKTSAVAITLGCLMFPACFIAFFCTCLARNGWGIGGPQPSPVDEIVPIVAAAIVAGGFIIAIFLNRKR